MKIIFKDVGQGDSIILEWLSSDGRLQIGLIDCNKNGISNPIVDFIKTLNSFDFYFIVLSHPHDDHYSGLFELLDYIERKKIRVDYFLHTCWSEREFLKASVKSYKSKRLLSKIFRKANELYNEKIIINYCSVNNFSSELQLEPGIYMKFLAPYHLLIDRYNKIAFANLDIGLLNNNPDANLLSTVIKLYSKDWLILLTSDSVEKYYWDANRAGFNGLRDKLLLGQIPHHGSEGNYFHTFWRLINHDQSTFGCISVGVNDYGHPGKDVILKLKSISYNVVSTLKSLIKITNPTSVALNTVSEVVSPTEVIKSADIVFKIENGECKLV